ncbi:hypothetical protein JYA63_02185 [Fictibacillus nanhaiensis]|uniref:Uncharacterized protein n=1 Tax=Fictibacillus nanhaiensis TaxID=742169 RepID=A0ABS2ZK91_9BACL|nr:hypothetical protein [Fictibacillus nanhaiensis]
MITVKSLPEHIKEVARRHQKNDRRFHVFPSIFDIDEKKFYLIMYEPTKHQIVISLDGSVMSREKIKIPFLYALAYNASIENISNIGGAWVKDIPIPRYEKLINILNRLQSIISNKASPPILDKIEILKNMSNVLLEEQKNINSCVIKGLELTMKTNDLELVTIEDYKQMRMYVHSMVQSAYKQNKIQLDTEHERAEVLNYVMVNIFSYGFKLLPILFHLYFYKKNMRTSEAYGSNELDEIKKTISEDVNVEEDIEALSIVKQLRNPI